MTKVTILEQNELCKGFTIKGHAGYAEKGNDIVCAAISALTINCINSIDTFTNDDFDLSQDEEKGIIDFRFKKLASEKSQLLVDSMVLGLREIKNENKDNIKLDFKEV